MVVDEKRAMPFKLNAEPKAKVVIHDVAPRPKIYSAVEEIHYVTLIDFRRLATTPAEAGARLQQKFVNLREESMLLFLDGWEAWKQSPLYREYVSTVSGYLARGSKLETLTADKTKLQPNEIAALVSMERTLAMV